ncbi:trigger factor [Bhargavaea beijingensis]|uniref:Trigger factor n=1 Tax=Bhargavaea beijingensis TaxID=426756 RepID=A0ABX9Z9L6_9BACL|nr:trigger factor [Bhargavaea beijingensis]MCW1926972.1 trigger factor [Bhargavaea beijingensis]RSK24671.1 trigger factor [Bhargavaea beijingensis]
MAVNWEKQEGNQGLLTFEVPAETFNKGLDQAFKKVVKQVNVPGFRKGKVPRKIFEQMFGVESLYQDAIDAVLPEAYTNAIDEAGISPVAQPEIDVEEIEKGKPVVFKANVTVKPEVKLGEYKGLEVERQDTAVTDEEIEEQLNDRRQGNAEFVIKEDEPAAEGDTVVIDFEGFTDGEPFEGGKAEGYELELGSGSFIPGFEEQLVGVKAGDSKDVEISFPEEYHAAELAGKPATFKVTVHEVKARELPELDDEFAKEIDSEVESLDALRSKLKEQTAQEKKDASEAALRDDLVEQAAKNADIDIPEVMVEGEVDRMVQEFGQRLQQQGMTLDLYYQFSGQDEAALRAQMKEDAETRVRVSLVLESIAEAEGITVSDEDIQEELQTMSGQFNMDTEQIKQILGGTEMLENDIRLKKTIEFLVENAKISE